MLHLYVHVPFCKSRCAYCDFYSSTAEERIPEYVDNVCREIEERREERVLAASRACRVRATTIYIGGGTPSRLSAAQLMRIIDCLRANYDVTEDAEVTVEMNPDDIKVEPHPRPLPSREWREGFDVEWLCESVNRVSLGVQTFDDGLLRLLRRRHSAQGAVDAVRALQGAGIGNISIDLIYGLPGQSLEMWRRDMDMAFSLGVQHLSAYALSYEEGTALTRLRDAGRITEVPEETSVAMYESLCDRAKAEGFEHYEISNWALPGLYSRHNSAYWTGEPYLGFGPGAYSFDGVRTRQGEVLTDVELYDEAVMCGLRTSHGVEVETIRRRFGDAMGDYLLRMAAPHLQGGRLALTPDGRLVLTRSALMVSDDVMSDLMGEAPPPPPPQ